MRNFDFDLGIIGGGAAGLTATAGAARLGAKTLLIEREARLGGDCLHHGCVPSKTLLRSAAVYHLLKNCGSFGLPQPELPAVDFRLIRERIRAVIGSIQKHDSAERFCKLGAKVEFGHGHFRDEHSVTVNGKTLTARSWLIATGSSPSIPDLEGLPQTPHLTNRDIFSLTRLPASLLILGAGPIAVELAQAFCRLGSRVTIVQRSDQILSKEDRDMADSLMEALVAEGISIHLNATALRCRNLGAERELSILDRASGREETLRAECLFIAQGREANVDGMGLAAIGVAHSPRGIGVDDRLRTSHKHIYAAGDVTGRHQFTHVAGYEAGVVITNAIFRLPRKADYTWLPWCTYSEPELASIGYNEKRAKKAEISHTVWTEDFADNDRARTEGTPAGRIKLLLDKRERPLGVQILGAHAGEVLAPWIAALNGRVKLATLAAAMHPYPSLSEINKRIAGAPLAEKIFSARVKKALTFFFNLQGRACSPE